MKLKIKDVVVGERFRKEYKDIEGLAESIKETGQIEPVVLTKDNRLIAGERRLKALELLKHTEVEVVYDNRDLTEAQIRLMEIEENCQRSDLTWSELIASRVTYHTERVKQAKDQKKKWTQEQTADALRVAQPTISLDFRLHDAIGKDPTLTDLNRDQALASIAKDNERAAGHNIIEPKAFDPAVDIRTKLIELITRYGVEAVRTEFDKIPMH